VRSLPVELEVPLVTPAGQRVSVFRKTLTLHVDDDVPSGALFDVESAFSYRGRAYEFSCLVPLAPLPQGCVKMVAHHEGVEVEPAEIEESLVEKEDGSISMRVRRSRWAVS
jgi:hypothetical protein